jgi:hypothetical protein
VLKPGGVIGVCSPDWGGFVLAPPSARLSEAIEAYTSLQTRNGGDTTTRCLHLTPLSGLLRRRDSESLWLSTIMKARG